MEIVFGIIGFFIVLLVIYDISYTTLGVNGAGKISSNLSRKVWKTLLKISGKNGESKILKLSGQIIVLCIFLVWMGGLWLGQALIFNMEKESVLHSSSGNPATFSEIIYFTGYTISSLGNGDFIPAGAFWQIYTAIVSFTGITFITMALTYLVPVLSAVTKKRQLGQYINQMGRTPFEILDYCWDGDFKEFENHLSSLNNLLMQHTQQHLAYPILHYFHESNKNFSTILNLAALDEAISILLISVKKEHQPDPALIGFFRKTQTHYLETIRKSYTIGEKNITPPIPGIETKNTGKIPFSPKNNNYRKEWEDIEDRRQILHNMVMFDGWKWETVYSRDNANLLS